jgi:hypothetical protein
MNFEIRKDTKSGVRNGHLMIFVPLPLSEQTQIPFGCGCGYCKAHPEKTPMWDCQGIDLQTEEIWRCHYPDL